MDKPRCLTVGELIEALRRFPSGARVWPYEGTSGTNEPDGYHIKLTTSQSFDPADGFIFSRVDQADAVTVLGAPAMSPTWMLNLSVEPARVILSAITYQDGEGQLGNEIDPVLSAIALQHPELVQEFGHLPWPAKARG